MRHELSRLSHSYHALSLVFNGHLICTSKTLQILIFQRINQLSEDLIFSNKGASSVSEVILILSSFKGFCLYVYMYIGLCFVCVVVRFMDIRVCHCITML